MNENDIIKRIFGVPDWVQNEEDLYNFLYHIQFRYAQTRVCHEKIWDLYLEKHPEEHENLHGILEKEKEEIEKIYNHELFIKTYEHPIRLSMEDPLKNLLEKTNNEME